MALRVRRSERTNGIWLLCSNCSRTFCGALAHPGRHRGDLGVELVVVDLEALGGGHGPQGEVDPHGRRPAVRRSSRNASGSWPVARM